LEIIKCSCFDFRKFYLDIISQFFGLKIKNSIK
jgi:hypothetical protein